MVRLHWALVTVCATLILVIPTIYRYAAPLPVKYRWAAAAGWVVVMIALGFASKYVRRAIVLNSKPRTLLDRAEAISTTPSLFGTLLAGFSGLVVGSFIILFFLAALWSIIQAIFYKQPDKPFKERKPLESVLRVPAIPTGSVLERYRIPPSA